MALRVSVGRFKAQALAVIERVASTGEAVLITVRRGPGARLVSAEESASVVGSVGSPVPAIEILAKVM